MSAVLWLFILAIAAFKWSRSKADQSAAPAI